jgi:FHA domain
MTDGRKAPLRPRSRRRGGIAGGIALCWIFAYYISRSAIAATMLLVAIGGLGMAAVAGLRVIGINGSHPWLQRMASRPWRDGQDVLNAAMRHLPDVFVVTPSGSLLAPNIVEVQMNPDDLISLRERMELDVIRASATEVYQEQVAARGARFAGPDQADVYVVPDESVAPGRYRLRQGVPVSVASPSAAWYAPDARQGSGGMEFTLVAHEYGPGADGSVTVLEQARPVIPVLRLVTGSSVAETVMSGARAGRGSVELVLPDVSTVSREHAKFTFSDGRWWVTNQGRNGLCLNGAPVAGERPLGDGDSIRWGTRSDALVSRVEIR